MHSGALCGPTIQPCAEWPDSRLNIWHAKYSLPLSLNTCILISKIHKPVPEHKQACHCAKLYVRPGWWCPYHNRCSFSIHGNVTLHIFFKSRHFLVVSDLNILNFTSKHKLIKLWSWFLLISFTHLSQSLWFSPVLHHDQLGPAVPLIVPDIDGQLGGLQTLKTIAVAAAPLINILTKNERSVLKNVFKITHLK